MRKMNYFKTFLFIVAALICVTAASAQEAKPADAPPPAEQRTAADQPRDIRGNILRQLGLSEEQIQQIHRLNAEKKPLMGEAQKRLRDATHVLDESIYADQVNEADIQARLKEVQLAQAEMAKLRYVNELAVRRILTQEQLIRFRELRQRFEKARENFERQRPFNNDRREFRQRPGSDARPTQDGQPPKQRVVPPVK